ncbi:MAG TPA: GspE/PulE family protein [Isosphaeraceae bacterium]|jgi:type II secretory ATPase GspE/PulE/Tfp pilus assembly ATPase PilB-like protein|nr:GspE/PulE family protein [Isosphaeraceae bacterium]
MSLLADPFRRKLAGLDAGDPRHVVALVDLILAEARAAGASDVHLLPTADGLELRWRIDGVLQAVSTLPATLAPNVVARLKVVAELLTYRTDLPQEGRIRGAPGDVEMRVSTFPTLHGEKAVVRLFVGSGGLLRLDDLGLPVEVRDALRLLLDETSGAILLAGPAGSGKTTTIYACLRELAASTEGRRSLVTLEDPIEAALNGVSQSQVNPAAGFDLATGLRSLVRQDPEVIAVGEIRDRATAEVAFQASLTGHLVLSTFHAGGAAEAIGRLVDMGVEPFVLRSGLRAVVCQRLLRRLCSCARAIDRREDRLGLDVLNAFQAVGCPSCRGAGYRGRLVLAELLRPDLGDVGPAILARVDVRRLESLALAAGLVPLRERARTAVEEGLTSPAEVRRVLGFAMD